jgi:hypothetical protein
VWCSLVNTGDFYVADEYDDAWCRAAVAHDASPLAVDNTQALLPGLDELQVSARTHTRTLIAGW